MIMGKPQFDPLDGPSLCVTQGSEISGRECGGADDRNDAISGVADHHDAGGQGGIDPRI